MNAPPSAPDYVGTGENQNDLLVWMETCHANLGAIYQSHAYGAHVYVTHDPHHAEHVLRRNYTNYRKGRAIKRIRLLLGNGLMVSEGDLWKRQRRMVHPAFHEKAIAKLTTVIQEGNAALVRRWTEAAGAGQPVNITRDISAAILDIILKSIFGNDYPQAAARFGIISDETTRTMQFAQEFRALGGFVREIAASRGDCDDMLGLLMRARDRDTGVGMSATQLVDEILTLVVAGHETTASTLNWAWYLLSQNPWATERLEAEVTQTDDLRQWRYAQQIIEETMRLYPAGWLMTRQAIQDDRLGDYFVPAKTEIYISPYIIQRRPDLWPDPDRFDPERFAVPTDRHPMAMIPFSAGPRNCIGEHLARWEMLIHMGMVARQLRLDFLGGEPEYDLGVNLRSKQNFLMQPVIRP